MWLLVGLGNPGSTYMGNRHNIGFMAADALAKAYGFAAFSKKFQGLIAEGQIAGQRAYLYKPMQFMNCSGQALLPLFQFYKFPLDRLVVLHDELDLPLGTARVKKGGGAAGHNGLKDIDAHLGADYWRVRLGISHPGDKARVHSHVLSDFSLAEKTVADAMVLRVVRHIPLLLSESKDEFSRKIATDNPPCDDLH